MGMSSYVMDCEEQFYEGAEDVKIECDNIEDFMSIMSSQLDLVKHLELSEVTEVLKEIWSA